jgi:glycosyltransferase involved in cell wall biosynthesis
MLYVHVLPETPRTRPFWVCAELRLISPLTHPSVSSRIHFSFSLDGTLPSGRLDAVLVQRRGWPGLTLADAQELVRAVLARGAKLIYDIDDDLLCTHPIPSIEADIQHGRPVVRFLAAEANMIICSTDAMASRMAALPAPKKVWRNALDERKFIKPKSASIKRRSRQTAGYAGTPSHLRDLLSVTESLRGSLSMKADRVGLDFMGVADVSHLNNLFGLLLSNAPRSVTDYNSYLETMQTEVHWDVAMAPLLECGFNESKSDIKFLEYGAFGMPGVYSKSNAYATVIDGELGILAEHADFGRAVLDLLEAPERRRVIAQNAYDYVMQERTLTTCAGHLIAIIEALL